MDDMDIDMGMDNEVDPEIARLQAAAADIDAVRLLIQKKRRHQLT